MTTQVYLDRFSYQIIKNGDQSVCVYFCMCQFCLFESYGLDTGISYTHTMYVTLVYFIIVVAIKYKFLTFGSETSESNAKWN